MPSPASIPPTLPFPCSSLMDHPPSDHPLQQSFLPIHHHHDDDEPHFLASKVELQSPALPPDSHRAFPSSVKYLVWNEFCERFSYYGMRTILALFLLEKIGLSETLSTEIVHLFIVACYATPVLGALLSDCFLGKYRTILYLSILYSIGNWVMALAAVGSADNNSRFCLYCTSTALGLIAIGTGGIKPCVSAFGGDQIEWSMPDGEVKDRLRTKFFSLFYFAINAGSFMSTILTPVLRKDLSYGVAFAAPAVLMLFAVLIFMCGHKSYINRPPEGNVFPLVGRIIADAFYLCKRRAPEDVESNRADSGSNSCHWLDAAKLKHEDSMVEDVKTLLRVFLVLLPAPLFWSLFDQQSSKWVFQARDMDGRLPWLRDMVIQPDQMQAVNPILILLMIPFFDKTVYPILERVGLSLRPIRRMLIGMLLCALAFLMSGLLQLAIESAADTDTSLHNRVMHVGMSVSLSSESLQRRVSMLWQIPQYALITAGEIMFSITGLEFAYSQAPDSMKSVVQAIWLLMVASGNFVTVIIVATVSDGLSKANEFFLFSAGCAFAMVMMMWLGTNFKYRSTLTILQFDAARQG